MVVNVPVTHGHKIFNLRTLYIYVVHSDHFCEPYSIPQYKTAYANADTNMQKVIYIHTNIIVVHQIQRILNHNVDYIDLPRCKMHGHHWWTFACH